MLNYIWCWNLPKNVDIKRDKLNSFFTSRKGGVHLLPRATVGYFTSYSLVARLWYMWNCPAGIRGTRRRTNTRLDFVSTRQLLRMTDFSGKNLKSIVNFFNGFVGTKFCKHIKPRRNTFKFLNFLKICQKSFENFFLYLSCNLKIVPKFYYIFLKLS